MDKQEALCPYLIFQAVYQDVLQPACLPYPLIGSKLDKRAGLSAHQEPLEPEGELVFRFFRLGSRAWSNDLEYFSE